MKWNKLFSLRISELIIKQLQEDHEIKLHQEPETIRDHICALIQDNFKKEKELDEEVYKMMEDLEQQGHSFERHKMYPELKKQLAKKKGIVL